MRKVILASASPWRKRILATAGIPFVVEESGYEEKMSLPLPPRALARHLALGKARAVACRHKDALVIGADTIAVFRGEILGKPGTPARARAMLSMLSGKTHTLLTGFALVDSKSGRAHTRVISTRVTFKELSARAITRYASARESLTSAGAYAIQGRGTALIEKVVGDRNNVAGFPLAAVRKELAKFGVHP